MAADTNLTIGHNLLPKTSGNINLGDSTHKWVIDASQISGTVGSATNANKLATARTIGLGAGATGTATSFDGSGNITIPVTEVKESYLSWGGKNFSASYGPIDAAMIPDLGANRLAFMPAAGVEVQYSTDGGSTWSIYSAPDTNKINLFNGNGSSFYIGASHATGIDKSNYQLRIIITTDVAKVYTILNKFVIYCSTNGSSGSWCTIDAKTKANADSGKDTWVNFANKVSIAGWAGYNIINTSGITTYGNTASTQYQKLRFTFGVTSHASSVSYPGLTILKIMGFGGVGWIVPSTMARSGRMYTYDADQNVTFPAGLTATTFNGSGKALKSLNASNISSGTLPADRLATSGVTAGSYGDDGATRTVSNGDTFSIPYVTVDAKGRVTSASTKTMTLNAAGSNSVVLSSTEPTNDDCVIWVQV